jgi:hypothetical protein
MTGLRVVGHAAGRREMAMPQMRKLVTEGDHKTIYINADAVQNMEVASNTQNTTIYFGNGSINVLGRLPDIAVHLQYGTVDADSLPPILVPLSFNRSATPPP